MNASSTSKVSRILTAEQILAMDDLNTVDVEIEEWKTPDGEPGVVRLKALTAREALQFQRQLNTNAKAREDAMINIVVMSAVDENGDRIFNKMQMELLRDKAIRVFGILQKAAMKLNGFENPNSRKTEDELKND